MALTDLPPAELRERARKARELAETWHVLLTVLADELDALAAEREREAAAAHPDT